MKIPKWADQYQGQWATINDRDFAMKNPKAWAKMTSTKPPGKPYGFINESTGEWEWFDNIEEMQSARDGKKLQNRSNFSRAMQEVQNIKG
jgi:hypothetical protein